MNPYEYKQIQSWVHETINSIYSYKNSVLGILDTVSNDYNELDLDATQIFEKLSDKDNLDLVRDVLTKLG